MLSSTGEQLPSEALGKALAVVFQPVWLDALREVGSLQGWNYSKEGKCIYLTVKSYFYSKFQL